MKFLQIDLLFNFEVELYVLILIMGSKRDHIERTQLIDIDKILNKRNPGLYKKLPKFVLRYLRKTLRQDEINEFIKTHNHLPAVEFLKCSFEYFDIHSEVFGKENLPNNGNVIFVSNHPIGSFDGLHIISIIYSKYGTIKAVVNDLLLNVKNLNEFFLGVNKHGLTSREYVSQLNKVFDSDIPIFFFPAGLVSRKKGKTITDAEWKKTFLIRALKHKRDIVPIYIDGRLTNKFYRIANFRKFFNIKANLEMFYLPDEMIKQKGRKLKISIGKPIPYISFLKDYNTYEWSQKIKTHVYSLKNDLNKEFMKDYKKS